MIRNLLPAGLGGLLAFFGAAFFTAFFTACFAVFLTDLFATFLAAFFTRFAITEGLIVRKYKNNDLLNLTMFWIHSKAVRSFYFSDPHKLSIRGFFLHMIKELRYKKSRDEFFSGAAS